MNKKGLAPLFILIIAGAIALTILVATTAIFQQVKYIVLFAAAVALAFLFFPKGDVTQNRALGYFLVVGIGAFFLLGGFGLFEESVFGLSEIETIDGKTYWVWSGVANKIDEGFIFTASPQSTTLNDGTTLNPQKDLKITISKEESSCNYVAMKQIHEYGGAFGFFTSEQEYYTLSNPERIVKIKVTDNNDKSIILDGYNDNDVIADDDFVGLLNIETQGILGSNTDCPESSNVAVVVGGGTVNYFNKAEFLDYLDNQGGTLTQLINAFKNSPNLQNNAFTSGFSDPPQFNFANSVYGPLDIGSAHFTITADQHYFDSTVLAPPEDANPSITDISIQDEVNEDSTFGMTVDVKNNGGQGPITIKASGSNFGYIPTQINSILNDEQTYSFTVKAGQSLGTKTINVEVCSVSQFSSASCDTDSATIDVVEETVAVSEFCGDNICQASETFNSCPTDCDGPELVTEDDTEFITECGFAQVLKTSTETKGIGPLGIGGLVGLNEEITTEECVTADWVKLLMIGVVIVILAIVLLTLPKGRKKRR